MGRGALVRYGPKKDETRVRCEAVHCSSEAALAAKYAPGLPFGTNVPRSFSPGRNHNPFSDQMYGDGSFDTPQTLNGFHSQHFIRLG